MLDESSVLCDVALVMFAAFGGGLSTPAAVGPAFEGTFGGRCRGRTIPRWQHFPSPSFPHHVSIAPIPVCLPSPSPSCHHPPCFSSQIGLHSHITVYRGVEVPGITHNEERV